MEIDIDTIQDHIPYYLTRESKDNLLKALQDFPKKTVYYTTGFQDDALQGDGWTALSLMSHETGERKKVRGIILSNSCDIDTANKRDLPVKLVFASIIKLKAYAELLKRANISEQSIADKFRDIRNQKITTLLYLPPGAELDDEYVALLDDIHSIPLISFTNERERAKLFTLSQAGHYIFLIKLSFHFCRFHEQIIRDKQ